MTTAVDIRSIKQAMQMDVLRCKTPEMVPKEVWTHLLTYNLLRTVMAVTPNENEIEPREISSKGTKQTVTSFAPKIVAAESHQCAPLLDAKLKAIAYHRVRNRPGRWEPRAVKKRPQRHNRLTQPRDVAKKRANREKWH